MASGIILNTRPLTYRERFHAAFAPLGWSIIDSPALTARKIEADLPSPDGFDSIVFTSQVAVDMLGAPAPWSDKTAYAVGPATADAARRAGFTKVIQTGLDAKDLIARLTTENFKSALYPSAEDVSADIAGEYPRRVHRVPVYRMEPAAALSAAALAALQAPGLVVVPLFSRRSAQTLQNLLVDAGATSENTRLIAVSISPEVLTPDAGPWQRRAVADTPTLEAVVAKTATVIAQLMSGTRT